MPQQQGMYPDYSARDFLHYMAAIKELHRTESRTQIEELLAVVNLSEDAHKRLGGFSGGMRQRVLLAQALLGGPKILILDEPTAGLDPKERLRLRQYISDLARSKIVFLTTHIVSDIESIANDVLLMKQGELVAHGAPDALIAAVHGQTLEDVYMAYLGVDCDGASPHPPWKDISVSPGRAGMAERLVLPVAAGGLLRRFPGGPGDVPHRRGGVQGIGA